MSFPEALLLFFVALAAGAQNSVAGGGSFLTVPTLIFTGMLPIQANATNTVALWPGAIASIHPYRDALDTARRTLLLLSAVSIVGGILGALILIHTPQNAFLQILPFLLLGATALFAFGSPVVARLRNASKASAPRWVTSAGGALLQFIVSLYGGFFGGGIGILMLATLSLTGMRNIHTMNALKVVLASCINSVALITFIFAGIVEWPQAAVMMVGAIIGGWGGASLARKIDERYIRIYIIVVGVAMSIALFVRAQAAS
ncbi:MAG TPA: sulfite exporter TauE/SafE family protein [Ktedonobacterales bacterium]|nr:sulfite exporter TauE/SafE family protein [Ktedonobacterales bacterium]